MVDFIISLLPVCLFIWGWHVLFNEGMILGRQGQWMKLTFPEWIHKPLFSCPACMSSIYGTIGYFVGIRGDVLLWPVYCICLCGLNYLIAKSVSKERIIIDEE